MLRTGFMGQSQLLVLSTWMDAVLGKVTQVWKSPATHI